MSKKCAVLFSGGLDSSLAVCYMVERNYIIQLLHFNTGALLSNRLIEIRMNELKETYPNRIVGLKDCNISGLFRKIALVSLENDINKYHYSLVCVGCKLAMHIQSIIYCRRNNIKMMADGSTERQKRYGEQREITISFLKKLYANYDIEYCNPVYDLNEKEIKYGLFDRNLTIQPLEDTCLFSNTFSIAPDEVIAEYLNEKLPVCNEIIERGLSYEND